MHQMLVTRTRVDDGLHDTYVVTCLVDGSQCACDDGLCPEDVVRIIESFVGLPAELLGEPEATVLGDSHTFKFKCRACGKDVETGSPTTELGRIKLCSICKVILETNPK